MLSKTETSRDQQKTHHRPLEVKRPEHGRVKAVPRAAAVYDRQLKIGLMYVLICTPNVQLLPPALYIEHFYQVYPINITSIET